MLRINQLQLPVGHSKEDLFAKVRKVLRMKETPDFIVMRRSVDARKKPELYYNYVLDINVDDDEAVYQKCDKKQVQIWEEHAYRFPIRNYQGNQRPVVIGSGPAGLFCALMLARAGFRPLLLERGKPIEERMQDVQRFWEEGCLDTESNVQFGEGGAGTFSDGKLNTLVKDTYGLMKEVQWIFVGAGAPPEILYDYKPHIGTDVLCKVVENMRHSIEEAGGEVRFQALVTDFKIEDGQIKGVVLKDGEEIAAAHVVLAPGHSARDTFAMLYDKKIQMEAKPFAVGMRVEHPQELINQAQYGVSKHPILGNAPYKVTAKATDERGVYSFCMCPGGYVVNASSEQGCLAVNGMSYHKRDGENANSAIIVSVSPEDYGSDTPLAGVEFQRRLEEKAYQLAGGKVPVERYGEYKRAVLGEEPKSTGKVPEDFKPCIKGEWEMAPVHEILPKELSKAFAEGMEHFGNVIPGFNDENVLVEGMESRTSSPVRIIRDESFQSSVKGLYPCGEGAGYAGGIMSAAIDGIRIAEAVADQILEQDKCEK